MVLGINGHSIDRSCVFATASLEIPHAAQICEQTVIQEIKSKHFRFQIYFKSCGAFASFRLLSHGLSKPEIRNKA